MATALQFRRGTTAELSSQTGLVGELFVDTTKDTVVVMDGSVAGGYPLATESGLTSGLAAKQATLVSGTNIKTINGTSLLGSGDITLSYATESYVSTAISNLVDTAPSTLDTLNELAAALGDDANFASTVTASIGTKLNTSDFTTTANTWLGTKSTSDLTEGTNLYYTDARVGSYISSNNISIKTATEAVNLKTNPTGTVTHDCSTGAIWYYYQPSGNVTANFTNIPSHTDKTFVATMIIQQGATAYIPTAVEINGTSASISWSGGSVPSGTANKTNVVSFSIFSITSIAGGPVVLGELSTYG